MKLLAFCEASDDFRLIAGLVDLMLRESGQQWVIDLLDTPDAIRTWHIDATGLSYINIHRLNDCANALAARSIHVRQLRGHFDGRPGERGAALARKAFLIAEALSKSAAEGPIDAVVVVIDIDQIERADGVKTAGAEARSWEAFQVVCGVPDPEREAWVLAGFDPCNGHEQRRLDDLHRELGFSPVVDAKKLRDRSPGSLRDIKRVLRVLTGDDRDREARCWIEPPLATLRARGAATGLNEFLDELERVLPPLLGARRPQRT